MREPDDAPDHLAGSKTQHVGEQLLEPMLSLCLERRLEARVAEEFGGVHVTAGVRAPQIEKSAAERLPEALRLVENEAPVRDAIIRVASVPRLRVPADQQVAEEG